MVLSISNLSMTTVESPGGSIATIEQRSQLNSLVQENMQKEKAEPSRSGNNSNCKLFIK